MTLPRLEQATYIADQLNLLANVVKTRSRASLTDANRILETIARRFFNALCGWNLTNLNIEQANFPAADLGDRGRRIAIQVTNEESSDKIKRSKDKAVEHNLDTDFDELIVFFLLPRKPGFPRQFTQPPNGPNIVTWDIADLLQQMLEMDDLAALASASSVLREEMGKLQSELIFCHADISRIVKYAPADLVGREAETALLNDAWEKALGTQRFQRAGTKDKVNLAGKNALDATARALEAARTQGRPHILTFVAMGGEGKTSLVAKWAAELAAQGWLGCDAVFAWSFYSQGTREQTAASSDLFLAEALRFFGDEAMARSTAGAFEKGQRLARLVGERRALLILDGLEPLQYAPTAPLPGELKDQGLAALLKGLAANNHGLCVVTTRYALPDLRAFLGKTVREETLTRLATEAGVKLLKDLGVKGSERKTLPAEKPRWNEYEQLVEDVKGHALTLNLLGTYLRDAHAGDIRRRDRVQLAEADAEEQGGHTFRVIEAYVRSFEDASQTAEALAKGRRALALLQLLGPFDRPATADCLNALWQPPTIAGLTEPLIGLSEAQRNMSLKRLEDAKLLTVNRDAAGTLLALDAHPLLREYFAQRLKDEGEMMKAKADSSLIPHPSAFRAAHRRLYEHLCATTKEGDQPTLEDLQPLYQAVTHGCQGGLHQEVCDEVYIARIIRGRQFYSTKKLGAFGADIEALACFFDQPWGQIASSLDINARGTILALTPFRLRALGRLTEGLEPMRASVEHSIQRKDWENAAGRASNLSELELMLGEVSKAVGDAKQSVIYSDRSGDALQRITKRITHADTLHQAGRQAEAEARFREAEQMQAAIEPDYPLLYSLQGFRYCDLLLAPCERAAWRKAGNVGGRHEWIAACRAIAHRAAQTLKWMQAYSGASLLDITLDQLTLGKAAFYEALLAGTSIAACRAPLDQALSGLRRAASQDHIPHGLLTRAWFRYRSGVPTGPDSAQADLDEAWEIASRGPMRLFMADIHLYRARLFSNQKAETYPWESVEHDLAEAERLINECGYGRRKEELADAQRALLGIR